MWAATANAAAATALASGAWGCHIEAAGPCRRRAMSWTTCLSAPAPQVHLARAYLEHRGVPCLISSAGPSIYPVPVFGLDLLVPEEWLPVARKFLERPPARPRRARSGRLQRVA